MSTLLSTHMAEALALRAQLMAHPIYRRVDDARAARLFMEHHVFAVWDFMSLLKSLQRQLTCVSVPWVPPVDCEAARLINEIVLAEESDEDGRGRHAGHYDLYVEAMANVGADTKRIERFVNALRAGLDLEQAVQLGRVPEAAAAFVHVTLDIALHSDVHDVAAAFFLGRENVIPEMFIALREALQVADPQLTERLSYYLARHIEIDGDAHGPAAERLLLNLCERDDAKWAAANATACRALRARMALWDGVLRAIDAGPGAALSPAES